MGTKSLPSHRMLHPQAGVADDMSAVKMFEEQSQIIRGLAQKAPGVFLGKDVRTLFWADRNTRTPSSSTQTMNTGKKEGREYYGGMSLAELKEKDEMRNSYYRKFTGIRRDDPKHYDMVVNVSKTGVEGTVSMILDYIRNKEENRQGGK